MANFDKDRYVSLCLLGDYNKVAAYLESLDDAAEKLAQYKAIFEGDAYFLEIDDERVAPFVRAY